jgi:hypothetical protein
VDVPVRNEVAAGGFMRCVGGKVALNLTFRGKRL